MSVSPISPLALERLAVLEAATDAETPYGGRDRSWMVVATAWVTLQPSALAAQDAPGSPPAATQSAVATARDHPLAAAGQRLTLDGEPPWRVREVRRGDPAPGRMTLALDRLL